ncbi:unnamed protein product, partial [Musa banksii]
GWRRREPFVFGSCGSSACGLPGETKSDGYPSRRPRSPERRRARGVRRNLQQQVSVACVNGQGQSTSSSSSSSISLLMLGWHFCLLYLDRVMASISLIRSA